MKIGVVGTGYVGLVTGACLSKMGNTVTCVDIDEKKIEDLKNGIIPIYEPGLEALVKEGYENKTLLFTTKIEEALETSNILFIAVGTPMGEDGEANLCFVEAVARNIGKYMNKPLIVVDKSTVPVGTADWVRETIQEELDRRGEKVAFDVVSNPEFLKEGAAIDDFMKPERVIVGSNSEKSQELMRRVYEPFMMNHDRFIAMDIRSAEMTKYAANAMLATKISFMNEIAHICEKVGANINEVRRGIGSDSRIGYSFIYPGCGYGGSCFPKDVQALIHTAKRKEYEPQILQSVEAVNYRQKRVLVDKVIKRFGEDLKGFTFGIWGLSFKPKTDDMREASSVVIINELTKRGAKVVAYDPKAMDEAKNHYLKNNTDVSYVQSKYDVLKGSDALLLVTEWSEFRSPDFKEIAKLLKSPIIFDGRNQYNKSHLDEFGIEYFQIGVL